MRSFLRYQAPFLLACVSIFALSSFSFATEVPLPAWYDKVLHAIVFGILAVLAYRAFLHQSSVRALAAHPAAMAIIFATIYGALDEYHQSFVPGRTMDAWDVAADVLGAIVATMIIKYWTDSQVHAS